MEYRAVFKAVAKFSSIDRESKKAIVSLKLLKAEANDLGFSFQSTSKDVNTAADDIRGSFDGIGSEAEEAAQSVTDSNDKTAKSVRGVAENMDDVHRKYEANRKAILAETEATKGLSKETEHQTEIIKTQTDVYEQHSTEVHKDSQANEELGTAMRGVASDGAGAAKVLDFFGGSAGHARFEAKNLAFVLSSFKFPAIALGVQLLASAISSLLAGIIALIPQLAQASSLVAGLPGLFFGLVAGVGAGVLALKGLSDGVKALNQLQQANTLEEYLAAQEKVTLAFQHQTPEARAFAEQLVSMRPLLDEIRATAQRGLLPGLGEAIGTLTKLFPTLNTQIGITAKVLGDIVRQIAARLTTPAWLRDLPTLFDNGRYVLERFGTAFSHVLDAFRNLAVAAGPLTRWLADLVANFAMWLDTSIAVGRETGRLQSFFERAMEAARQLGRIIENTAVALFDTFKAGSDLGHSLWDTIEGLTSRWREWTGSIEGQSALKDWFAAAKPILTVVGQIIGELAKGFFALSEAGNVGLLGTLEMIRDQLVPAIVNLGQSVATTFGPALVSALTRIVELFAFMGGQGGQLTAFLRVINFVLQAILDLLDTIPGLKQFAGALFVIAGTAQALKVVGAVFVGFVIGPIETAIQKIGKFALAFSRFVQVAQATSFGEALGFQVFGRNVASAQKLLSGFVSFLSGWGILVVAAIALATVLIVKNWDDVKAAIQDAWDVIEPVFDAFVDAANNLWGAVKEAFSALASAFSDLLDAATPALLALGTLLGTVVGAVVVVGLKALTLVLNGIAGAVRFLTDVFTTFFDLIPQPLKDFAAQAGVILLAWKGLTVIGPILETAILAPLSSLVQYIVVTAVPAIVAGVGKMVIAFSELAFAIGTNGLGAGIASTFPKLAQFVTFLTTPWGIAVAGATAVFAILIATWQRGRDEVARLTAALIEDQGAIAGATREAAARILAERDVFARAKEIGIDLNLITDAALGNADAYAEVKRQAQAYYDSAQTAFGRRTASLLVGHLDEIRGELVGTQEDLADIAEVAPEAAAGLDQVGEAADGVATSLAERTHAALAQVGNDLASVAEAIRQARDAAEAKFFDSASFFGDLLSGAQDVGTDFDPLKEARQRLSDAQKEAARDSQDAADSVASAERQLVDALEAEKEAQDGIAQAREDARTALHDLRLEVQAAALAEASSQLGLLQAKRDLREAILSGGFEGSDLDFRQLQLGVRQAKFDVKKAESDHLSVQEELRDAERKGISNSDQLVEARKQLADATQSVVDAEKGLADSLESQQQTWEDSADAINEAKDALVAVQGAAGDASSSIVVSSDQVLDSFKDQLASLKDYHDAWDELQKRGAPQDFLDELAALGIDGKAIIESLAGTNDKEFNKIIDLWRTTKDEAADLGLDIDSNLTTAVDDLTEAVLDIPHQIKIALGIDTGAAREKMKSFIDLLESRGLTLTHVTNVHGTRGLEGGPINRHTGGEVDYTGSAMPGVPKPGEVDIRALTGEWVWSREAVRGAGGPQIVQKMHEAAKRKRLFHDGGPVIEAITGRARRKRRMQEAYHSGGRVEPVNFPASLSEETHRRTYHVGGIIEQEHRDLYHTGGIIEEEHRRTYHEGGQVERSEKRGLVSDTVRRLFHIGGRIDEEERRRMYHVGGEVTDVPTQQRRRAPTSEMTEVPEELRKPRGLYHFGAMVEPEHEHLHISRSMPMTYHSGGEVEEHEHPHIPTYHAGGLIDIDVQDRGTRDTARKIRRVKEIFTGLKGTAEIDAKKLKLDAEGWNTEGAKGTTPVDITEGRGSATGSMTSFYDWVKDNFDVSGYLGVGHTFTGSTGFSQHAYGNAVDFFGSAAAMLKMLYEVVRLANNRTIRNLGHIIHAGKAWSYNDQSLNAYNPPSGTNDLHYGHVHVDMLPQYAGAPPGYPVAPASYRKGGYVTEDDARVHRGEWVLPEWLVELVRKDRLRPSAKRKGTERILSGGQTAPAAGTSAPMLEILKTMSSQTSLETLKTLASGTAPESLQTAPSGTSPLQRSRTRPSGAGAPGGLVGGGPKATLSKALGPKRLKSLRERILYVRDQLWLLQLERREFADQRSYTALRRPIVNRLHDLRGMLPHDGKKRTEGPAHDRDKALKASMGLANLSGLAAPSARLGTAEAFAGAMTSVSPEAVLGETSDSLSPPETIQLTMFLDGRMLTRTVEVYGKKARLTLSGVGRDVP